MKQMKNRCKHCIHYYTYSCMRLGYAVPFIIHYEECKYFTENKKSKEMSKEEQQSALSTQVGGDHYKDLAIQPVEFIQKNELDFISGNIIKYAARHRKKNKSEDVEKIIHYAKLLLQIEYGYTNEQISKL